ncbi:hypothetical protein MMYC01_209106 [Madurella mycetomatis]|uniref:Heterokaryon incompatibility domain-containing protein n=1 Tax=Madurella mycetomatis TaxID=100816 RepID=A0A175VU83_9PEZI|nr:hypothetical protein MMYC01_209106 [Madurella mycetomatis]
MFTFTQGSPISWNPTKGFHFSDTNDSERVVFLQSAQSAATHPAWMGRSVQPIIDPALIKKWLFTCEESHKDRQCCPEKHILATKDHPSGLKTLRVIDVVDRLIITAPPSCRYVALSYQWGQGKSLLLTSHTKTWFANGFLSQDIYQELIPRTIRDAMTLVSTIGERYLWVDSLCLMQDDAADMADGIKHMDLIYQGAILTIIAASGTDNNAGLPGLHPRTRQVTQILAQVKPGVIMATASPLYRLLKDTRYMSRGWTCQELLLSRRCLIFTPSQVFFRCRVSIWSEDTCFDAFPRSTNPHTGGGAEHTLLVSPNPKPYTSYVFTLYEFNNRDLSHESDAQDAMAGILRHLVMVRVERVYERVDA